MPSTHWQQSRIRHARLDFVADPKAERVEFDYVASVDFVESS